MMIKSLLKKVALLFYVLTLFYQHSLLFAQSTKDLYNTLIDDLTNINIAGYKAINLDNYKRDIEIQGALYKSDNDIDIGIVGKGFFKYIDKNNKIYFSRNGKLHLSTDGTFRNEFNDILQSKIILPNDFNFSSLSISSSGIFEYKKDNDSSKKQLFILEIFEPTNKNDVKEINGSKYIFTNAVEINNNNYKIISGCFEGSTVSPLPIFLRCMEFLYKMKYDNEVPIYIIEARLDLIKHIITRIDQDFMLYYQIVFPYLRI